MKALFIKEFRQGRPLLIFAAIMALLIPLSYAVFARAAFLYLDSYNSEWLPLIFGFAVMAVPPLIAAFASSGLFCSEAHRGTLPVLFALPLSRCRIWLAKLLAALALTLAGSLLVLIIGGALLPGPYRELPLWDHLPELCCCIIFSLALGAFCSSLSRSVNAALPAAVLLGGAIIAGAAALRFYYGAPLLGPPWLDIALWCLFASPALLLASALVLARGELLESARKWLFGAPVALLGAALIVLLVIGVARATTTYDRSDVSWLTDVTDPAGGPAVCLLSQAKPFGLVPRWLFNLLLHEEGLFPGEFGLHEIPVSHRASYAVTLDLTTGRELFHMRAPLDYKDWTRPSPGSAACSPDGRLAALITQPAGLTWGIRQNRPAQLHILDTHRGEVLYLGLPDLKISAGMGTESLNLSWSPSGDYLALSKRASSAVHVTTMYLLRVDGSQSRTRPLILRSPYWAPNEDVIYGFDGQHNLVRAYPDDRANEVIWTPRAVLEDSQRRFGPESISPDGKWIAVYEYTAQETEHPGDGPREVHRLHVVPTDSGDSRVIWREDRRSYSLVGVATWSGDGRFLYLLPRRYDEPRRKRLHRLLCWSRQADEMTPIGPEIECTTIQLLARPHSDQAILRWLDWEWPRERRGQARLISGSLVVADAAGAWHSMPFGDGSAQSAVEHAPIGFDSQGRLIFLAETSGLDIRSGEPRFNRIEALDLDTGAAEQIYP